jgi:hypothetical protein
MSTKPEALRLAKELVLVHQGHADEGPSTFSEAAAELCRLYELAQEQHTEIYGLRLEVRNLLEALKLADAMLSGANMNISVVENKVRAAIAKATGEQA